MKNIQKLIIVSIIIFSMFVLITRFLSNFWRSEESCLYSKGPERNFCLLDLAFRTNDITYCKMIENKGISSYCMAILTKNVTYCKDVEDKIFRDECYRRLK